MKIVKADFEIETSRNYESILFQIYLTSELQTSFQWPHKLQNETLSCKRKNKK